MSRPYAIQPIVTLRMRRGRFSSGRGKQTYAQSRTHSYGAHARAILSKHYGLSAHNGMRLLGSNNHVLCPADAVARERLRSFSSRSVPPNGSNSAGCLVAARSPPPDSARPTILSSLLIAESCWRLAPNAAASTGRRRTCYTIHMVMWQDVISRQNGPALNRNGCTTS
jgi:hypothetical protein